MRSLINTSMLLTVSGLLVLGITSVSAAPQHESTAAPQTHAPPTPTKPAASSAHQAPPIPPAEPAGGAAKDGGKPVTAKAAPVPAAAESSAETITADAALDALNKGNVRWVADKCTNPHDDLSRRSMLAENGQHPTATILTCSDSRLPVERLFDCGVGDVFVVRVAGNIMATSETATIEYGLEHLHTPLLVVMGHSKCGAVNAAVTHAPVEGSIAKLVDFIEPAVERAHKMHPELEGADLMPEAIRENVWQSIFDLLKNSEIARHLAKEGKVRIVGAICDISTGKVEFLGEHPWQSELLSALSEPASHENTEQTAVADEH